MELVPAFKLLLFERTVYEVQLNSNYDKRFYPGKTFQSRQNKKICNILEKNATLELKGPIPAT